ncbi:Imm10 family immunity protein [Streptomyces sp. NPDC057889]|uniref:Imm10 family immunity protein n=1 Tax=unclassified Streptomyces TaxID=2593676 RepID=UPI0036B3A200
MTYSFTAQLACGLDDPDTDDCMMAGVAESNGEDGFSLLFMRDFHGPDEQDVAMGMDTHCLVTPDQGTAYGCVREIELNGDVVRVTLNPASLDDLGLTDPIVEATLRAPAEDLARMRGVLPRVLAYGREDARPRRVVM